MVWQMRGGPACAEVARKSKAAKIPAKNKGERTVKAFMICCDLLSNYFKSPSRGKTRKSRLPKAIKTRGDFQRATNKLLPTGSILRPRAFPSAPKRNVSEVKLVPPQIEHLLIKAQNTVARHSLGRWNERCQAVVNKTALRFADAHEKMPHGERVALARFSEYFVESGASLLRRARREVKLGQGLAKRWCSVFKIRSARTHFRSSRARGTCGDKSFMAIELETNPPKRRSKKSRSQIVDFERVGTA